MVGIVVKPTKLKMSAFNTYLKVETMENYLETHHQLSERRFLKLGYIRDTCEAIVVKHAGLKIEIQGTMGLLRVKPNVGTHKTL